MKIIAALFCFVLLSGCSWTQQHGILKGPDGKIMYEAEIPSNALLTVKEDGKEIVFDTRGNTGLIEQLLVLGASNTSVQLKNKGGDD